MSDSARELANTPSSLGMTPERRPARERVVEVARRLFRARGYERTALRSVSEALGVTKAAVYYHFRAKEDLLAAIVGPTLDRIDLLLEPFGARLASAEERRRFLAGYIEELSGDPAASALLLRDPAVADHPLGRRFAAQHGRMRALLGADDSLIAGIRTATALRALELAVIEFGDTDPVQVRETALNIALAVLEAELVPPPPG